MADSSACNAVRLYNDRRRRSDFFPRKLFSDQGWDLLLWLFIETERGRRVSITEAARAIQSTTETASRWIAALQQMNLVDPSSTSESLMLADEGHRRMKQFLGDAE
ncbi:hypothetical protein [Sphingomonas rubra]|uniref:hypothetical protein n=1 Tax=Sphingomonas rubra TaxID=634430 RepID=UPI00116062BB|nr:hypothetical protein [Sphingomonas rubra]